MEDRILRVAPLAGVAAMVLIIAGFAIEGSTPSLDDAAGDIMQSYIDNDRAVIAASALSALGAVALLLFSSDLSARLRARGSTLLASTAFAGAVVCAAGIGVDAALRFTLADSAGEITAETFAGLFALWNGFFWPIHLGMALLVGGAGLASLDSKMLPAVVGGLGPVAAILLLIPVLPVTLAGLALATIWIFVASVLLWRQPRLVNA
jgi:hypothetical protein